MKISRKILFIVVVVSLSLYVTIAHIIPFNKMFGIALQHNRKWAFGSKYKALSLGMSLNDLREIMDVAPTYEFSYGNFRVLYFVQPPPPEPHPRFYRAIYPALHPSANVLDYTPGMVVNNLNELPDLYGFIQIAVDSNDQVCAYTWIGESGRVESVSGSIRGSRMPALGTLTPYPNDTDE